MSVINAASAVQLLERGELVAIPTETVYGLAGRIDREETLRQIFSVKGRPFFDPLIVHVSSSQAAFALTSEWPEIFNPLVEAFWPGPLTLVAPKAPSVSPLITSGLPTVAVRCPRHPVALQILNDLKVPLAAPSANLFGQTSPTSAAHVEKEFAGKVAVVDGGHCEVGVESTVLAARKTGDSWLVEILRPGGVSRQELTEVLQKTKYKFSIERAQSQAAPGHLPHHYQPSSPLVIVRTAATEDKILQFLAQQHHPSKMVKVAWLELDKDSRQAARLLYQAFRELSRNEQVIAVKHLPHHDGPEWEAVWDRIERASSFTLRD